MAVILSLSIFRFEFISWNINYSTLRKVNSTGMNFIVDKATIMQNKVIFLCLTNYPLTGFLYKCPVVNTSKLIHNKEKYKDTSYSYATTPFAYSTTYKA